MKKSLALILSLLMLAAAFSGCKKNPVKSEASQTQSSSSSQSQSTSKPAEEEPDEAIFKNVKGPITLKVALKINPVNGDIPSMWFWKEIEELSGIKFDVQAIHAGVFHDKKTLMITSNQLPDMFLGYALFGSGEVMKYGKEGVFVNIKDKIPNMKFLQNALKFDANTLKGSTTPEGAIYSLPCFNTRGELEGPRYFINVEWLDNLGLEMPKTVDDLKKVLVAFRDRDPDGDGQKNTFPISGVGVEIFNLFRSAFGFVDDFDVIDGKVKYFPMEPEYKEYYDTLNKFYMDNLIDHDMRAQSDEDFKKKARAMKVGIFAYGAAYTAVGTEKEKWSQYELMKPITAKNNITAKFGADTGIYENCAIITKANKYVDESLLFLDFLYSEKGTTMLRIGPQKGDWEQGKDYGWAYENGGVKITPDPKYPTEWEFINAMSPCINILPCFMPSNIMLSMKGDEKDQALGEQIKAQKSFIRKKMPEFMYTQEEAEKLNNIIPYVQTTVNNVIWDYVIGVKDVNEITNLQADLKRMGIEDALKIMQAGYNRYNAVK